MQNQKITELVEFLDSRAEEIRKLEKEGEGVLETDGQTAFLAIMEKKAELLASLGEDAWSLTKDIGGEKGDEITQRLEQFSMSASTALRIGSVFFMTALLYPEEHKPGDPNDLETYIAELRSGL